MEKEEYRKISLEALTKLKSLLLNDGLGASYVREAIKDNPWFSHYYIDERVNNILSWLGKSQLESWIQSYPLNSGPTKNVGLITAGNLPLVGFHDLLTILLSGHKVQLKASRRDRVLMERIFSLLIRCKPEISSQIQLVSELVEIDYLIASGGNQAAKQLRKIYKGLPQTIRKHRFSVAVLKGDTRPEELKLLLNDIFLFNGQGCRNVSNILLPYQQISPLINAIKTYPQEQLTSSFQRKLAWERAKNTTMGLPFLDAKHILLIPSKCLQSTEIGTLCIIPIESNRNADEIIQKNINHLQCVVNKGIEFGESQYPAITAFEDNVDLLKILTHL